MNFHGLRAVLVVGAGGLAVSWMASCSGDTGTSDAGPDATPLVEAAPPADVTQPDGDRPDTAPPDAAPPPVAGLPPRIGAPTTSTTSSYYAVYSLLLGDFDRSGAPGSTAWKRYGYDLDSKTSTDKSTDHCRLKAGASARAKVDGDNGADNSFGSNILPILTTAQPEISQQTNAALRAGDATYILQVTGFDEKSDQSNIGLSGQVFGGGQLSPAPKWDGTDLWPVLPGTLAGGTLAGGANAKMNDAYVSRGLFVGVVQSSVNLTVGLGGIGLVLPIERPIFTFQKPTNGLDATTGTIAGVMNTARFVSEFRRVAGQISTSLCEGSTMANIAAQLAYASDIMSDGTNGDPSVECDAISVGLGFTAKLVKAPTAVASPPPVAPDPCNPPRDAGGGG